MPFASGKAPVSPLETVGEMVHPAHEVLTQTPQTPYEREVGPSPTDLSHSQGSLIDTALKIVPSRKRTALLLSTLASTGATVPAANASMQPSPTPGAITITQMYKTHDTFITINGVKKTNSEMDRVTLLAYSNANGMSKDRIKKLKKLGGCGTLAVGTRITNSGRQINGRWRTFPDTVKPGKNRYCADEHGRVWFIHCNNRIWIGRLPSFVVKRLVKGPVVTIRSWNKGSAKVESRSHIEGRARCENANGFAEGSIKGDGYAWATLSFRNLISAKGRRVRSEVSGQAEAMATSQSDGEAIAICVQYGQPAPGPEMPPPEKPPEQPPQQPEEQKLEGQPQPSEHRYVDTEESQGTPECVDNIVSTRVPVKDVEAGNFVFTNQDGEIVGSIRSNVFTPDGRDNVRCAFWNAGLTPQSKVWMGATISDGVETKRLLSAYSFEVKARPTAAVTRHIRQHAVKKLIPVNRSDNLYDLRTKRIVPPTYVKDGKGMVA